MKLKFAVVNGEWIVVREVKNHMAISPVLSHVHRRYNAAVLTAASLDLLQVKIELMLVIF